MTRDDGATEVTEIRQTCGLCGNAARLQPLPFDLNVCGTCLVKLEKPVLLDGVVSAIPMRALLEWNEAEFKQRTESLLKKCKELAGV